MDFIYFNNRYINKYAILCLYPMKFDCFYRVYIVLANGDNLVESFRTEEESNKRYHEILECLNSD